MKGACIIRKYAFAGSRSCKYVTRHSRRPGFCLARTFLPDHMFGKWSAQTYKGVSRPENSQTRSCKAISEPENTKTCPCRLISTAETVKHVRKRRFPGWKCSNTFVQADFKRERSRKLCFRVKGQGLKGFDNGSRNCFIGGDHHRRTRLDESHWTNVLELLALFAQKAVSS